MIFADAEYYQNEYLLGRAEIVPLSEFIFWARKASDRINWRRIELDEVPEQLKLCTCEVAEAFYLDSEKKFMAMEPSQSVGPYSKGAINVKSTPVDFNAEVSEIITRHLAGTVLHNQFVYRGA